MFLLSFCQCCCCYFQCSLQHALQCCCYWCAFAFLAIDLQWRLLSLLLPLLGPPKKSGRSIAIFFHCHSFVFSLDARSPSLSSLELPSKVVPVFTFQWNLLALSCCLGVIFCLAFPQTMFVYLIFVVDNIFALANSLSLVNVDCHSRQMQFQRQTSQFQASKIVCDAEQEGNYIELPKHFLAVNSFNSH